MLIAHGAANPGARAGLRAFENRCRRNFPGVPVRWACASSNLRERLAKQRQKHDSPLKALQRLRYENFTDAVVQPLRAIRGKEYEEAAAAAAEMEKKRSMRCVVGAPLLSDSKDAEPLARAILAGLPPQRHAEEDVVLTGHGARHPSRHLYDDLAEALHYLDPKVFFGSLNDAASLDAILGNLTSRRVWLLPALSLVGGHAQKDMAGEHAASWKSRVLASGHACEVVLKGLSENERVADIWLGNLRAAMERLRGEGE